MTSVTVAAPDLSKVNPSALAVANFLRHNKELKSRKGIIGDKRHDFFRGL